MISPGSGTGLVHAPFTFLDTYRSKETFIWPLSFLGISTLPSRSDENTSVLPSGERKGVSSL